MKTIGCRSFKVAEDAFNSSLLGIYRSMHVVIGKGKVEAMVFW